MLTDAGRDPPGLPGGQRGRRVHRRDRLDAHLLARPRCGSPGSTRCDKPLLHLHTQSNVALPWATIDMDFMNLNQAAHGDREFGYIQSRLGGARARRSPDTCRDPRVVAPGRRRWARAAPAGARPRTPASWPASATTCATSPSPRATRSRPQLPLRRLGQHLRRQRPGRRRWTRSPTQRSTSWSTEYEERLRRRPRAARGRRPARVAALRRRASNSGCAPSWTRGGFGAFTDQLRGPGRRCGSCRAWPCSG